MTATGRWRLPGDLLMVGATGITSPTMQILLAPVGAFWQRVAYLSGKGPVICSQIFNRTAGLMDALLPPETGF